MFKRNNQIYVEESEDSIILYNNENNGKILVLNEIGSFIFKNLDNLEIYEIKERIMSEYDINENELNNDVDKFICDLEALHVIERC